MTRQSTQVQPFTPPFTPHAAPNTPRFELLPDLLHSYFELLRCEARMRASLPRCAAAPAAPSTFPCAHPRPCSPALTSQPPLSSRRQHTASSRAATATATAAAAATATATATATTPCSCGLILGVEASWRTAHGLLDTNAQSVQRGSAGNVRRDARPSQGRCCRLSACVGLPSGKHVTQYM